MPVTVHDAVEFLYAALRSSHGITVSTSDPHTLRTRLYAARKKAGDPDLANLSIVFSPFRPEEEVWIVRHQHGTGA